MININYGQIIEVFIYAHIFLWVLFWSFKWSVLKSKNLPPKISDQLPEINLKKIFTRKLKEKDAEKERETERDLLG